MTGRAFVGPNGSGMVKLGLLSVLAVGVSAAVPVMTADSAGAETVSDLVARRSQKAGAKKDRLLVESRELVYDRDRNTVSAVGNAQLY